MFMLRLLLNMVLKLLLRLAQCLTTYTTTTWTLSRKGKLHNQTFSNKKLHNFWCSDTQFRNATCKTLPSSQPEELCNCLSTTETALQRYSQRKFSGNIQQIYRRKPMLKCDINKNAMQFCWNHASACGVPPINICMYVYMYVCM